MPILNIPEYIEVEYDSISNEQRAALKLIMDGDGLYNPLTNKINESIDICNKEIEKLEALDIFHYNITQQEQTDILYLLEALNIAFEDLKIHTDRITGNAEGTLTEFFQRLSIAGQYTKIMKSISGKEEEKYSFIFSSIMGAGDLCLDRISKRLTCQDSSTRQLCGNINDSSGILELTEQIKNRPVIINSVITCLLPSLLECVRNLTNDDDYSQARKIVESYSAGTRIAGDITLDPIYNEVVKQVVGSHQLKQSLLELEKNRIASDSAVRATEIFFENFPYPPSPPVSENDCRGECCDDEHDFEPIVYNCNDETLILVGPTGPPGKDGFDGIRGIQGIPGGTGDCECEPPPPSGACCVDFQCYETTQGNCSQWDGVYRGDNTSSEFEWCGPCRNNNDCDLGKICCDGECLVSCCDGLCPPCPPCNCDDSYPCGDNHCCPSDYCCVDCDSQGGGDCAFDSDCPLDQCCDFSTNTCRLCPECLINEDCPVSFVCINGFCLREPNNYCTVDDDCESSECCVDWICQPCLGDLCETHEDCPYGYCCLESYDGGEMVCRSCDWASDCGNFECAGCEYNPLKCQSGNCSNSDCACCFDPLRNEFACHHGDCPFGGVPDECDVHADCEEADDSCCFYRVCTDCIDNESCGTSVEIIDGVWVEYTGCVNDDDCVSGSFCCYDVHKQEYCCGDASICNEMGACCITDVLCQDATYASCDSFGGEWYHGFECTQVPCGGCVGDDDCTHDQECCVEGICVVGGTTTCGSCLNFGQGWCGEGLCCTTLGTCLDCSGGGCSCACWDSGDCSNDNTGSCCVIENSAESGYCSDTPLDCPCGNADWAIDCGEGWCCVNNVCVEQQGDLPCNCSAHNECPWQYCCVNSVCVDESEGLCPCSNTSEHCSQGYCCWYSDSEVYRENKPRNRGGDRGREDPTNNSCCVEDNEVVCVNDYDEPQGTKNCCFNRNQNETDREFKHRCRVGANGTIKLKPCCDSYDGSPACRFECGPSTVPTHIAHACNECPEEQPRACCLGSGWSLYCDDELLPSECENMGGVIMNSDECYEGICSSNIPDETAWGTCQCCNTLECTETQYPAQYCSDECTDDWILNAGGSPVCACIEPINQNHTNEIQYTIPNTDAVPSMPGGFDSFHFPPHCKRFDGINTELYDNGIIQVGCAPQEGNCINVATNVTCGLGSSFGDLDCDGEIWMVMVRNLDVVMTSLCQARCQIFV